MAVSLLLGHRGYSALYPENTMVAFIAAYTTGVGGIEIDLQSTSDGVIVIMHDDTVDRTTDGTGTVTELTYEYIRALDAGSWKNVQYTGEHVPTLEDVLDYFKGKDTTLCFDVKAVSTAVSTAINAAQMIKEKGMEHQCVLWCPNYSAAVASKIICGVGNIKNGVSISTGDLVNEIAYAVDKNVDIISTNAANVTADKVTAIHAAGKFLTVAAPITVEDIQAMVDLNVDAIMSDYCDRLVSVAQTNSIVQSLPTRTLLAGIPKVHDGTKFKTKKLYTYKDWSFREANIKG